MRDPESFVRGGPTLSSIFRLMRGGRIQKPLLAVHHRPASESHSYGGSLACP